MIVAGHSADYSRDPGDWVLMDIGFSGRQRSGAIASTTGVRLPSWPSAKNLTWAKACDEVERFSADRKQSFNLMIEAPLSASFDQSGNPAPRSFEVRNGQSRAWYLQGGAVTALAASMFLARLRERASATVHLYEAFLSFKSQKTDHASDAEQMLDAATNPLSECRSSDELKERTSDRLESILASAGFDFGVPPVFVIKPTEGAPS